ncbi:5'-methylthioadenosine/S-adenosylhomocysteine nucleosidase [Entomoplasma ellychniae]|uniref:adenosylhomocysteine nucleosidase n=1 Tax=Entomoplasma ellychniae TaxID=2114 RepID=A0A8E2UAL3_9MOLU|nr:5'-methylthioadenosine/S-adenosylhomocysteine nucleosidase [Entomoplasma ellychniae]PPE04515.1 5'-methylthioadenosine/S-adenosylhomocysteine nucleosidase [Entomoplasma ellychniae]
MKLIIGAMFEELQTSIDYFKAKKIKNSICNIYKNEKILFCVTGIGLINAAVGLSYVLNNYEISQVINIGTSGACDSSLKQKDIVWINKIFNSAADATVFGYDYGQIPKMPKFYETASTDVKEKYINKNLASSDIFINDIEQASKHIKKIPSIISVLDMECFGYAQTAYIYKKPFISIKVISDVIGTEDSNAVQFNEFIKIAGNEILNVVKNLI